MPERGLIVGKFYPPHQGHRYLIEQGRSQVNHLVVMVCDEPHQCPPAQLRAEWLRELCSGVEVRVVRDDLDPDDSAAWATYVRNLLGYAPDVVFTSEEYGERFAYHLGCTHICVDRARNAVPISGTQVRANPLTAWQYLDPPVRGYYAIRVCLVGAESTGKTTLAQNLASHYQTTWVAEYGREYSERMLAQDGAYRWATDDFAAIARTQCDREDRSARAANRVLICDTDAFATCIWHERYLGQQSPLVEQIAAQRCRPDLYLLTDVDTPFVQDGTRDGESIRKWMHDRFVERLGESNRRYEILRGTFTEREAHAIQLIDALLQR